MLGLAMVEKQVSPAILRLDTCVGPGKYPSTHNLILAHANTHAFTPTPSRFRFRFCFR